MPFQARWQSSNSAYIHKEDENIIGVIMYVWN